MAKVRFDINGATKDLQVKVNEALKDERLEKDIGIFLTDRVRFMARSGKPLNNSRAFPSLKDMTIEQRKFLEKYNKTQRAYAASKSNLTFTGQLQDAVAFDRIRAGIFRLFVKDSRRKPYRIGRSKRGKALTNEEVDKFLRKRGFILFTTKGLKSDKNIPKRIKALLIRYLRRQLRRT